MKVTVGINELQGRYGLVGQFIDADQVIGVWRSPLEQDTVSYKQALLDMEVCRAIIDATGKLPNLCTSMVNWDKSALSPTMTDALARLKRILAAAAPDEVDERYLSWQAELQVMA